MTWAKYRRLYFGTLKWRFVVFSNTIASTKVPRMFSQSSDLCFQGTVSPTSARRQESLVSMARFSCRKFQLASRAVHIALFASWIALVVWKVQVFLSEPTGTEVRFESQFDMPHLTLCSYYGLDNNTRTIIKYGTNDQQLQYLGNLTLQDLFRRGFWSELGCEGLYPESCLTRRTEQGQWTGRLNIVRGGFCTTLDPIQTYFELELPRAFSFSELLTSSWSFKAYTIHIHRLNDFWGAEDIDIAPLKNAEMASIDILNSVCRWEFVIDVERRIMPNLRRRPCAEDPSYSRSTCWRNCFLNSLNCSMVNDPTNASNVKPPCRAMDIDKYQGAYKSFSNRWNEEGTFSGEKYSCFCPRPCEQDRYSIHSRPSLLCSGQTTTFIPISFKPVARLFKASVTYDIIDLLADMGGFLGLFLGYSIFSVFDEFKSLFTRILQRFRGTATPPAPSVNAEVSEKTLVGAGSIANCFHK